MINKNEWKININEIKAPATRRKLLKHYENIFPGAVDMITNMNKLTNKINSIISYMDIEGLKDLLYHLDNLPPTMPELLTTKEVQEILQVSRPTIYRMIKSGDIKEIQYTLGGKKQFRKSEIKNFIDNQTKTKED